MNDSVLLNELIDRIQRESEEKPEVIKEFIHSFFQIISLDLKYNEKSVIYPFGTFKKIRVEDKIQWNPFFKHKINVPAHYRIVFKPMPATEEYVNKEFSHLSSVIIEDDNASIPSFSIPRGSEPVAGDVLHPSLLRSARVVRERSDFMRADDNTPSLLRTARIYRSVYVNSSVTTVDQVTPIIEIHDEPEDMYTRYNLPDTADSGVDVTDFYEQKKERIKYKSLKFLLLLLFFTGLSLLLPFFFRGGKEIREHTEYFAVKTAAAKSSETLSLSEISISEEKPDITIVSTFNHIIEKGDSFSKLSDKYWNNRFFWPYLYAYNRLDYPDPDLIYPGKSITFPAFSHKLNRSSLEEDFLDVYFLYGNLIKNDSNPVNKKRRKTYQLLTLMGAESLYPGYIEKYKSFINQDDLEAINAFNNK